MTKNDDTLTFDFTGSSPQSKYSVNCTKWASLGGLFAPLFPLLCYDIVWNEGVIRPITMIAPEGTHRELHAAGAGVGRDRRGDPVGQQRGLFHHRQDAGGERQICRRGDRGLARQPFRDLHVRPSTSTDRLAIGILTETFAGAGGARTFADGVDMGGEIPNPISRMANVETIEATFPIRYLFRRRLKDSGGPGRYRGGAGGEMAIVAHDAPDGGIHYVVSGKGTKFPQSEGLSGGYPGGVNDYVWVHAPKDRANADTFAQSLDHPRREAADFVGRFSVDGRGRALCALERRRRHRRSAEREPEKVLADVVCWRRVGTGGG